MRIYKDIFTGDEMFSDTYKIKLIDDVLYEVYGKLVTRKSGDIEIAGFNPSAEEAEECTDEAVESGVDIVLNHRLQETFAFGDKKSYTLYLKDYMKKLVAKLEEKSPDQVEVFKTNMNKVMKDILGRFKELQFFTGESMDIDGLVGIMEYREIDGESVPVMMFFKHGLDEEKF
ncbi:translationally-controlled tumor protein homolog [Vespula pensylvanica]|uniref:translationally-controlled tumor protein homolog n=1 Tax=Vespula pensylvanica TaxID=30213 RepID=UPI001CBA1C29|nr:translationally-controlled tumor protein homolog [Vespula pensylvanica]XP_043678791.1 translationally-controlled tumor protein homolog [Vespula pensylvanica]XP_050861624.1 translationally-controlled tumor protein homolog [Vespula vulgaris]